MATEGCNEFMLFGTRIVVDSMRKIASLNNLSDYQHVADAGKEAKVNGYVSDNVGRVGAIRERKRGTPWSEEEHKRFLMGLKKVGKGDWRGISKNFVKTRTPTQVASHAQKYFLRHNTVKSRRRSSLFDITTETVTGKSVEEKTESGNEDSGSSRPHSQTKSSSNTCPHPMIPAIPTQMPAVLLAPVTVAYPLASSIPSQVTEQPMTIHLPPPTPLQLFPSPSSISVPNYTPSLNLCLSLPTNSHVSQNPALQTMPRFTSKDRFISVV